MTTQESPREGVKPDEVKLAAAKLDDAHNAVVDAALALSRAGERVGETVRVTLDDWQELLDAVAEWRAAGQALHDAQAHQPEREDGP